MDLSPWASQFHRHTFSFGWKWSVINNVHCYSSTTNTTRRFKIFINLAHCWKSNLMPLHRIRKPFNLNLYFFDVYVYENENNFLLETEVTFSSSSTMPLIRHISVNFDENFVVLYIFIFNFKIFIIIHRNSINNVMSSSRISAPRSHPWPSPSS